MCAGEGSTQFVGDGGRLRRRRGRLAAAVLPAQRRHGRLSVGTVSGPADQLAVPTRHVSRRVPRRLDDGRHVCSAGGPLCRQCRLSHRALP